MLHSLKYSIHKNKGLANQLLSSQSQAPVSFLRRGFQSLTDSASRAKFLHGCGDLERLGFPLRKPHAQGNQVVLRLSLLGKPNLEQSTFVGALCQGNVPLERAGYQIKNDVQTQAAPASTTPCREKRVKNMFLNILVNALAVV